MNQPIEMNTGTGGKPFLDEDNVANLLGSIRSLDAAPSEVPKRFVDQFMIVTSGGSSRLYIYDVKPTGGLAWRYTSLT